MWHELDRASPSAELDRKFEKFGLIALKDYLTDPSESNLEALKSTCKNNPNLRGIMGEICQQDWEDPSKCRTAFADAFEAVFKEHRWLVTMRGLAGRIRSLRVAEPECALS